jgi:hypothetical protein
MVPASLPQKPGCQIAIVVAVAANHKMRRETVSHVRSRHKASHVGQAACHMGGMHPTMNANSVEGWM